MGDEPVVLLAAAARETDAEHRGMGGPGQPVDAPERRQRHVRLVAPDGAREGVPAREGVVHELVVDPEPDGENPLSWDAAGAPST